MDGVSGLSGFTVKLGKHTEQGDMTPRVSSGGLPEAPESERAQKGEERRQARAPGSDASLTPCLPSCVVSCSEGFRHGSHAMASELTAPVSLTSLCALFM